MKCLREKCIYNTDTKECIAVNKITLDKLGECNSFINIEPGKKNLFNCIYQLKDDENKQNNEEVKENKDTLKSLNDFYKLSIVKEEAENTEHKKTNLVREIDIECGDFIFPILYGKCARGIFIVILDWDICGVLTDDFYNVKENAELLIDILKNDFNSVSARFAANNIARTIADIESYKNLTEGN